MIDLLTEFPELPRTVLRDIKKTVDLGFKEFSRAYGESIEGFFYPLLKLLVFHLTANPFKTKTCMIF